MQNRVPVVLAALLLAGPALGGCLGNVDDAVDDGKLSLGSADDGDGADADAAGTLRVFVQRTDAGRYESASSGVGAASAVPADGGDAVSLTPTDGHVELASSEPVRVASGSVTGGSYGNVTFTLTDVHGTHDGSSFEVSDLDLTVDIPAGVPVAPGSTTTVIVGVDLAKAGAPSDGFDPAFSMLAARQDGEPLDENETGPQGKPPVARVEAFNGTGIQIYESDFEAAGGEANPVARKEEVTWVARPSDDPDGSVQSYEWTFSGGESATGKTVTHAFQEGGIHEATLTVTDDDGRSDSVTLQVPVRYLVDEDGERLYENSTSGSFNVSGDEVMPSQGQDQTRNTHTFSVPGLKRNASSHGGGGDGSTDQDVRGPDDGAGPGASVPVHGGGHGGGQPDDPETARRLAQTTVTVSWGGQDDAYSVQVTRDGEALGSAQSGESPITLEFQQLDGWYLDGGNYSVEVQYEQGVSGEYDVNVTGTYIPLPTE